MVLPVLCLLNKIVNGLRAPTILHYSSSLEHSLAMAGSPSRIMRRCILCEEQQPAENFTIETWQCNTCLSSDAALPPAQDLRALDPTPASPAFGGVDDEGPTPGFGEPRSYGMSTVSMISEDEV